MKKQWFSLVVAISAIIAPGCDQSSPSATTLDFDEAPPATSVDQFAIEAPHKANGPLAATIAQHPNFAPLSAYAWERTGELLAPYAELELDLLDEEAERLALCKTQPQPGACYQQLSGIDIVFGISPEAAAMGQAMVTDLNLGSMNFTTRFNVMSDAYQAYRAAGGPGGSEDLVPDTRPDGTICDAQCKDQMLGALAYTQTGVLAMMVAESDDQGNSGGIWVTLAEVALSAWIACLLDPDCDAWPFDNPDKDCSNDSDCSSDQYCWKGPLGIGSNECRDKKSVGEPCSRDGKCKSDCCKFNLWDGGSTCRVASEC